jgi:hypothetical protein
MSANWAIDDVVTFSPLVTGGHVVAKVTGVFFHAYFGYSYNIRITDGTRAWPTGATECVSEDMLDQ